ncbi:DUF4157 domain-containing protein [Actinomadura sp. DC4]|uniref:DUF4157 domain-containing protein n=1 Tax=Actinomadura sp. DC4 TaxID=3055069 RepID=UPI0025B26C40|nr:DUF4157 domain-containing protein [Actinomadura sp. DC4]MDN3354874.1 DUF4157 domain-containing protein [Actinomadura sp. DC4]
MAAAAASEGTWAVGPAAAALQRRAGNRATAAVLAPSSASRPEVIQRAPGRPLDPPVRARLESRFGADLSAVRVHTDEAAQRSAESLGADAYTVGSHIAFARGRFAPGSAGGLHLLAHETAHVLQQRAHRATGTDRGDGLRVSRPGDPLEREADAAAGAVASGGAFSPPASGGGASGTTVQRSVGLEMEHSVPIYQNLGDQEKSLRQGSYEYDNDTPIYTKGDVVVKVDNPQYSIELKTYLKRHSSSKYKNKIPEKGVSCPEYTTKAPGLDELEKNAADNFRAHTKRVTDEIKANNEGRTESHYYVGLPQGFPQGITYGNCAVQFTVGVFPSKLDKLHRISIKQGLVSRNLRTIQEDINTVIERLSGTISSIVEHLQGEIDPEGGLGAADRDFLESQPLTAEEIELDTEEWETYDKLRSDSRAALLAKIVEDSVYSVFRVALSYYLGARQKVQEGTSDKNSVALLARMHLLDVFPKAGLPPHLQAAFLTLFSELLHAEEEEINDAVELPAYTGAANEDVLDHKGSIVDLMIDIVRGRNSEGKKFFSTRPGTLLTKPDPLAISPVHEPIRLEAGGAQFEYRMVETGGWDDKFMALGRMAFDLNTEHLPPEAREELREETGWTDNR